VTTFYVTIHLGNWVACYDYNYFEFHTTDYVAEVDSLDNVLEIGWFSGTALDADYSCTDMVKNDPNYPGTGVSSITIIGDCDIYPASAMPVARATAKNDFVRLFVDTTMAAYIDLSCRLVGRSVIHEVENYGATCELTIVNDLQTKYGNILSSLFMNWYDPSTGSTVGWSDGRAGGITTGMVLQIREGDENGQCLGTFMVMTISAKEELITLSCGDFIQIMRATGAEYYRNHYLPGSEVDAREEGLLIDSYIRIDRPANVTLIGGAAGDVLYMVPRSYTYDETKVATSTTVPVSTTVKISGSPAQKRVDGKVGIEYIQVTLRSLDGGLGPEDVDYTINLYAGAYSASALICSWSVTCSVVADTVYTLNLPDDSTKDLSACGYIKIEISGEYNGQYGITPYVYTYITDQTQDADIISSSTKIGSSSPQNDSTLYCTIGWLKYAQASGNNTTYNDTPYFDITSISGGPSVDSTLITLGMDRAYIAYQDPEANINKMAVMADIIKAVPPASNRTLSYVSTTKEVNVFRCGGDSYHAYFLALADMEDSIGYQHAFCVVPGTWDTIRVGRRYKPGDTSQFKLVYAGDSVSGIDMMSFSPSITKRNRSYLATVRGKRNDGTPMIITVKDPNVAIGPSASVIGTSESSDADLAFQAYSQIMTNRSTDWEGTVELSGIHTGFMKKASNSTYIGGVPVTIRDSRYAMTNYRARVKEVTLDFQNQKTILVLNNYTEMYANDVLDSSKMAYQAGNMAVMATSEDLYIRQYIFVESGQSLPSALAYTVSIYLDGSNTPSSTVTASVIEYPELGVATVAAYFPAGVDYSNNQYAVTAVSVNSLAKISIASYLRPDKHRQQYLIVNVQMEL